MSLMNISYKFVKVSFGCRCFSVTAARSSNTLLHHVVNKHRKTKHTVEDHDKEEEESSTSQSTPTEWPSKHNQELEKFSEMYPEFLPRTDRSHRRDYILEMLNRRDMFHRRKNIDIPEFYVGSILAVTVSDQYAPEKMNRFVGICIHRGHNGLGHHFTLRNVIYGQGVEIKYNMYNPLIQKIECLKLEKRLDNELYYLRDCPAEYSTVPLDMEQLPAPKGGTIPVNNIQVPMNPRPWLRRWDRMDLKGVVGNERYLTQKQEKRKLKSEKPWIKHDVMLQYRHSLRDDELEYLKKIVDNFVEVQRQLKEQEEMIRTKSEEQTVESQ